MKENSQRIDIELIRAGQLRPYGDSETAYKVTFQRTNYLGELQPFTTEETEALVQLAITVTFPDSSLPIYGGKHPYPFGLHPYIATRVDEPGVVEVKCVTPWND